MTVVEIKAPGGPVCVSGGDRPPLPPGERMLQAAVRLISTQGVTGTGLREIVAASDPPLGSL